MCCQPCSPLRKCPVQMTPDELSARLEPWRQAHARTTWLPQLAPEGDAAPLGSRYGGLPAVGPEGERELPRCARCARPLRLLLQLSLPTLPAQAQRVLGEAGLLQAFHCQEPECGQELLGWAPFSGAHAVRRVDGRTTCAPYGEPFPVRAISGWQPALDHPDPAEHEALGLHYDYRFEERTARIRCPATGLESPYLPLSAVAPESLSRAREGDKLLGWPSWAQGVDYPPCPGCQAPMRSVYQLDSGRHLPVAFGDAGRVTLFQCEAHRERLTLSWAGA